MDAESLDRLFSSTAGFLRCRDRTELTARITGAFCEILGFEVGLLHLRRPEDDRFVLWASTGVNGKELATLQSLEDPEFSQVEDRFARCRWTGSCYLDIESVDSPRLYIPFLGSDQEFFGFVELRRPHGGHIDQERMRWSDRLAEIAALALESMISRDELKEHIQELTSAQERVEELESRQDEFLDGVSHELRTPLTSIQAYCEGLLNQEGETDAAVGREFLHVILEESRRLHGRVENLLAIARGEKSPPAARRRERFDLRKVVLETRWRMKPISREKGLSLRAEVPANAVFLEGDREALGQVALELVENAVKFSPEGGEITLGVLEDDGEVELRVEDTGRGIPENESARIFERFYQVDGSSTRVHGGQGLGLTLCRRIVDEHEGRIWVERAQRGGALFRVRLPRQRAVLRATMTEGSKSSVRGQSLEFLDLSVALVCELMSCRIASIMTYDKKDRCLWIQAAVGLSEEVVKRTRVEAGQGVAGRVFESGETLWIRDLREDKELRRALNEEQYDGYSVLSVPLRLGDEVIGVVNVNNKCAGTAFDDDDRLLLEALAERISIAFAHYGTFEHGYETMLKARDAFRAAVELNHRRRTPLREAVVRCGLGAARKDGASEDELRTLSYALRIYDLGLFAVGADLLNRPEPLGVKDRRILQEHSRRGAELSDILESNEGLRSVLTHHHENWDGSGYPKGLAGEAIDRGARVVRLVDAFSAMLHGRPGRPAVDVGEAISLVEEALGRRFCPRLGALFLEELRARQEELVHLLRWQKENGPSPSDSGPQWPRDGKVPAIQPSSSRLEPAFVLAAGRPEVELEDHR